MNPQTWKKWSLWLGLLLLIPVGVIGLLYTFQERLIFHPSSISPQEVAKVKKEHGHAEEVSFETEKNVQLHGWYLTPTREDHEENRLLIYYGGNAEELSAQVPIMSEHFPDWGILLVNYRGYGKSEGSPGETALYSDALQIYDEVVKQTDDPPPETAILMGRSIGTAVATHVAAERQADGLILVSPFDNFTKMARHHYPFLPVSWMLRHSFNSIDKINATEAPLLVITGNNDRIIPEERSQSLLFHREGSFHHESIEGKGHNDLHLDDRFWSVIHQFLSVK